MLEDLRRGNGRPGSGADGQEAGRTAAGEPPDLSFRELVQRVPAVLYVDASDEVSSALYVNPRGESLFGYSRDEWLEDPGLWVKVLHPEDRERVLAEHDRARSVGGPFEAEYRLIARDGSVVWVRDEAAPVEAERGSSGKRAGVLLDITDRKRYEEELRRSEERFRLVARATGEAIWDNDLVVGVQEWDGATEALFGYAPHQSRTGVWWEERLHPEDKCRVLSGLATVLEGGQAQWEEEYRFRRADGSYAHVLDRGRVVRDRYGRPVRMVGSMRDITERKEREEELRRSEELFRRTFESAAVGMAHLTPDGRWLRINDKLCEVSGYGREELLKMSYLDLTPPEDAGPGRERVGRLLAGEIDSYSVERRFIRKDGSRVWVNLAVSLVREASGGSDCIVCVAEDVTKHKIAELAPDPLTSRELDVLRLMSAGLTNPEIALRLSYSLGGIKHHVQHIIAKLGARNRGEAVARAIGSGLICPPNLADHRP